MVKSHRAPVKDMARGLLVCMFISQRMRFAAKCMMENLKQRIELEKKEKSNIRLRRCREKQMGMMLRHMPGKGGLKGEMKGW